MSAVLKPATTARDQARVLVVDDQGDIRRAIQLLLKTHGYEAHAAGSPAAALSAIAHEKYDLLIMDLNYARDTTSGREGLDLVPPCARGPEPSHRGHDGLVDGAAGRRGARGGADDFVEKPWTTRGCWRRSRRTSPPAGPGSRRAAAAGRCARRSEPHARPAVPSVAGYDVGVAWRFAEGLGGDAYEVVPLDGGRLAVAIADVCGKGLPAALLMASLHADLQAAAGERSPREAGRRVAAQMRLCLGPDRFVSLVYAILDRAAGTLVYVNAGHPPAILMRPDGDSVRLTTGGPVIGLGRESDFEEAVVPITAGARLALYTDGVTEAAGPAGEEFGERRLGDVVARERPRSAAEAAARLIEAAAEFAGGPLRDDATALVVTVE